MTGETHDEQCSCTACLIAELVVHGKLRPLPAQPGEPVRYVTPEHFDEAMKRRGGWN